jgi:hypothetical protein
LARAHSNLRRRSRRQRLGQDEQAKDHVGHGQSRGDEEGRTRIDVRGDKAADDRPEREAGTPGGSDETEIPGAVLIVAHVADVRAGCGV